MNSGYVQSNMAKNFRSCSNTSYSYSLRLNKLLKHTTSNTETSDFRHTIGFLLHTLLVHIKYRILGFRTALAMLHRIFYLFRRGPWTSMGKSQFLRVYLTVRCAGCRFCKLQKKTLKTGIESTSNNFMFLVFYRPMHVVEELSVIVP